MIKKPKTRHKILIADDSEMNRAILADMLGDEYDITEVENGVQAVTTLKQHGSEFSLLLLDLVMPEMDGFGVLQVMNQSRLIESVPVIMISAESGASHVEQAYKLGVTDFISRPFDAMIVHKRVINTILLYAKQKKLVGLVLEQIYEKEQQSSLMIEILSHIVEFRNGESGMHVLHIRVITELFLQYLAQKNDEYFFSKEDISLISTASALHDIGKISIPEEVLNKPGRLTDEEFTTMKKHTEIGAAMLKELPLYQDEPLVKTAYEICRWHHERYDGRGYPDGLKGDEIPISAQVVALADVYDALTSERAYKKAFTHEKAVSMILNGECGTFNPLLMDCLRDVADTLQEELKGNSQEKNDLRQIRNVEAEMLQYEELSPSARVMQLLEHERMKYNFFAAMSEEIQFEYTESSSLVTLTAWGAEKIGLPETIVDPHQDKGVHALIDDADREKLAMTLRNSTPEDPIVKVDCKLHFKEESRWMRFICRATWSADEPPQYLGAIGKAVDVHKERTKIETLERMASYDQLTGLMNRAYAQKKIQELIEHNPNGKFALAILDVDSFKAVNDTRGHLFGDRVLAYIAGKLGQSIREGDVAARVGGDEFLIFLQYKEEVEGAIERICATLTDEFEGFPISVSMGIALTEVAGIVYEPLFQAADQALYEAKRVRSGRYCFFSETLQAQQSMLSPIDGSEDAESEEDPDSL